MLDNQIARSSLDIVVGSEAKIIVAFVRGSKNPLSVVAIEGTFFVVVGDDILSQLRPQLRKDMASVADHRIVAADRILGLNQVVDRDCDDDNQQDGSDYEKGDHSVSS